MGAPNFRNLGSLKFGRMGVDRSCVPVCKQCHPAVETNFYQGTVYQSLFVPDFEFNCNCGTEARIAPQGQGYIIVRSIGPRVGVARLGYNGLGQVLFRLGQNKSKMWHKNLSVRYRLLGFMRLYVKEGYFNQDKYIQRSRKVLFGIVQPLHSKRQSHGKGPSYSGKKYLSAAASKQAGFRPSSTYIPIIANSWRDATVWKQMHWYLRIRITSPNSLHHPEAFVCVKYDPQPACFPNIYFLANYE